MYNVPVFVQEQGSERNTAIVPGDDCCRKGGGNKRVLFSFHTRAAGYRHLPTNIGYDNRASCVGRENGSER